MSYATSAALQKAVHARLRDDADLAALVGTAIFDAPPTGELPQTYITIGPETARDRSDKTEAGARFDFTLSVVTEVAGFHGAKAVAGAAVDALSAGLAPLDRGRLVTLDFLKARARREEAGQIRRIDLTFRARVDDD